MAEGSGCSTELQSFVDSLPLCNDKSYVWPWTGDIAYGPGCKCVPSATLESYELIARYVMPAVNGSNRNRGRSLDWAHENSGTFIPAMVGGITNAIADHEKERAERGGRGTSWVDAPVSSGSPDRDDDSN